MNCQKPSIKFIPIQNNSESVIVHVCFVICLVYLYICVCESVLQNNHYKT